MTGERANAIKAILGFIFYFLILKNFSIKTRIISLILLISLIGLFIYNSENLKPRYYNMYFAKNAFDSENIIAKEKKNTSDDFGLKIRNIIKYNNYFQHYRAGHEIFKKNFFFGVGTKNFGNVCYKHIKEINLKR